MTLTPLATRPSTETAFDPRPSLAVWKFASCDGCQLRELFLCVDGPVLSYERLAPLMDIREL